MRACLCVGLRISWDRFRNTDFPRPALVALLILLSLPAQAQMDTSLFAGSTGDDRAQPRGRSDRRGRGSAARVLLRRDGRGREDDRCITRRPVSDKAFKSSSVVPPRSRPESRHRHAGMGETELRGNIIRATACKTTDGGKTGVDGTRKTQVIRIRIHPTNPDLSTSPRSAIRRAEPERGVFRSKDGGKSGSRCIATIDPAPSTSRSIRTTRRPLRGLVGSHARRTARAVGPAAACSRAPRRHDVDGADEERRPPGRSGQGRHQRLGRRQPASTPSSRRKTAGSSCRTTRARRGSW